MHYKDTIIGLYKDFNSLNTDLKNNCEIKVQNYPFINQYPELFTDSIKQIQYDYSIVHYIYNVSNALEIYCEFYMENDIRRLQHLLQYYFHVREGVLLQLYCQYKNKSRYYLQIGNHHCY